jgi:twinkle protein
MNLSEHDVRQAMAKMEPPKESAFVKSPVDVMKQVSAAFHDPSFATQGEPLPFNQYEDLIRFRAGELTIWGGENHVGKSEVLNQLILSQMPRKKTFVMSPEMPCYRTMQYMTQQACASAKPSIQQIEDFARFADNQLFLLDQHSTFKPEDILNLMRYVVETYGVYHIVIDSLMKCGIDVNDSHAKIHWFIDQLCVYGKNLGCHTHLVAHNVKPRDKTRPNRYQAKGSGSISDLADNFIIMWRNFEKEDALQEKISYEQKVEYENQEDARLIVDKQRHGTGGRGIINLWHDSEKRCFKQSRGEIIRPKTLARAV